MSTPQMRKNISLYDREYYGNKKLDITIGPFISPP